MYQKWRDLLFLHWEYPATLIQQTLPRGLTVDTYQGHAFLGVVPFFMRDIRARFLPAIPGTTNFMEMNLRTYVYDERGRPGVWFYSLDADQWLAVRVARTVFNLPYFDATMRAIQDSTIEYVVHRRGSPPSASSHFRYTGQEELAPPSRESLEYFLIERYLLYAVNRSGALFSGRVHHSPYPLRQVSVEVIKDDVISLAGFEHPGRAPDHAVMSRGVDVEIFAIERVI